MSASRTAGLPASPPSVGHYAPWRRAPSSERQLTRREGPLVTGSPIAAVELLWGMRLTRKFIAALVIGVALVALVQGYLDYQREREVFDRQIGRASRRERV